MVKILVFISYSTKDSEYYKIKYIAEHLTSYSEIDDVLYWEEDLHENIIKYMNDNIGKCDILLLFCSENALKSEPVEIEWMAALKLKKKIIPIFYDENDIPPLLSPYLGINYKSAKIDIIIDKIYRLILKRLNIEKGVELILADEETENILDFITSDQKRNEEIAEKVKEGGINDEEIENILDFITSDEKRNEEIRYRETENEEELIKQIRKQYEMYPTDNSHLKKLKMI